MTLLIVQTVKLWTHYKSLIERLTQDKATDSNNGLQYWQNRLFTTAITYAMPISLLSLVPSVLLEIKEKEGENAILGCATLASIGLIALNHRMNLRLRKILVAILIILFAIAIMAFMGSFAMGCIYLFSLSIFISLQFSDTTAYRAVIMNVFICLIFAVILASKPFQLPSLYHNISLSHWIIYSCNFIFMDLVVVTLIRQLLNGLNLTIIKEAHLYTELQNQSVEKNLRTNQLKESEGHYKTLFFQSPLPKLIFDTETLQFLQVNEAAVSTYGYTGQEFLNMTILDLHSPAQLQNLAKAMNTPVALAQLYTSQHIKKGGQQIDVEIRRSDIIFKGKPARLIITTDITQQLNHIKAIETKNKQLKNIAHMQSHVVRVPLANIMGLSDLISQAIRSDDEKELLKHFDQSVKQLDTVVKAIVSNVEDVLP